MNEISKREEPSVRRLSLFDNISSSNSEKSHDDNKKTEPVISENTAEVENTSYLDKVDLTEDSETDSEFNASDDETEEDFNQEIEEELLDIPTFLRRQAN